MRSKRPSIAFEIADRALRVGDHQFGIVVIGCATKRSAAIYYSRAPGGGYLAV
jgi:hypothetical protein